MSRNGFLLPALLLALALAVSACGSEAKSGPGEQPPAASTATVVDVPVTTVTTGTVESALEISGTLAPRARVAVKPKLPGTLDRMLVDIGDQVKAGQVLATIDRREIDAQLDAAEAAVNVAKAGLAAADASLANAVQENERAKTLFAGGALPRQRLEAAETAHRAAVAQRDLAKATVAQAEASLRRAREVQRNATVTAPVSGYIVERNYDPGSLPGDRPIVVIADLREMKLEAGVSELEAGRLKVGQPAVVSVQAKPGETFEGRLGAIAPEVDERNRHFRIEVRVANAERALLSGMYASARIVTASTEDALLIPRDAVASRDGKRVVMKVTGDTAAAVEVVEGLSDGRRVQIVKGLSAGDVVFADARRQLPQGAKVKAIAVN